MFEVKTRYYYIPITHKAILIAQVAAWLASSPKAWVVLLAARYEGSSVVDVESGLSTMSGSPILERSIYLGNLVAFLLKGELDEATHNFAVSLEGVLSFDTPENYLDYINNL